MDPSQKLARPAPTLEDINRLLAAGPVTASTPRSCTRPKKWTEERIAAELERFLAGRSTRPLAAEWKPAGLGGLLQRLTERGELAGWLEHYGLSTPKSGQRWDKGRIRAELSDFLAGFSRWPSWREFRDAGRGRLCAAAAHHGGLDFWAAEFGLPRRPPTSRASPAAV